MIDKVSNRPVTPAAGRQAPDPADAKLKQAAEEFEAIFVERLLSQMRAANRALSGQETGFARQTYEGWQDQEFARAISRSGGMGLAEALYRQLQQQQLQKPEEGDR